MTLRRAIEKKVVRLHTLISKTKQNLQIVWSSFTLKDDDRMVSLPFTLFWSYKHQTELEGHLKIIKVFWIFNVKWHHKAYTANDASSWWQNDCMTTWLLTGWWTNRPSYRDAKMNLEGLVFLLLQYFTRKCWFPLIFRKAWPPDG